jgi:excisionase family DNA binding protein
VLKQTERQGNTLSAVLRQAWDGHVSRAFVYQLMNAGSLPYAMLGNRRKLPRRAVQDFAAGLLKRDEVRGANARR